MRFFISILFLSLIFSNKIEENKKYQMGIFQPLVYNKTSDVQIITYPMYNFIIPNLEYKKKYSNWIFSLKEELDLDDDWNVLEFYSSHSFFIPTPLLNIVKKEGMGGFISPEFPDFPFMISIKNQIEFKFSDNNINNKNFISTKLGYTLGFSSSKLDSRTTIDLPIIYPRLLAFYHEKGIINISLSVNRKLFDKLFLLTDLNLISTPPFTEEMTKFLEHKSWIVWEKSEKVKIKLGYKLVYGEYPFGKMEHLLPFSIIPFPLIDIVWTW